MLAARELRLERGGARVLEDVSCALEAGAITAICGPNGAGKSSLLLALAGLLPAGAGEVTLAGEGIAAIAPRSRAQRIGFLPQEAEVHWDVCVASLLTLGRLPHGDGAAARGRQAIEGAVAALDLNSLLARPVSRLSGGERARALLARVLAGEPDWILADEPLAALDLAHQLALLAHLRAAARSGTGVVLVLHDLALAMNHADRVLVLKEGRLIADGPPEQALSAGMIARGWGVAARWLGEPGARALAVG